MQIRLLRGGEDALLKDIRRTQEGARFQRAQVVRYEKDWTVKAACLK